MDVFFYEAFKEEADALKKLLPKEIQAGFTWKSIQEYEKDDPSCTLISIRTQSVLPTEWSRRLKGILTRSTGYDHIENYLGNSHGYVYCGYLPLYCNRSVAEQAMLMWMSLLRKLPHQIAKFPQFNRDGLTGQECEGKVLLVVGVGNIGYEVVKIGRGLGMNVRGVDIVQKHDSVNYVSIEEGIRDADIVVCAMNLTPENHGYFDYPCLKKTKPGALFINIARGEMSPSADLLRVLEEGHLGGVGLDVYNHESELAVSLREARSSADDDVRATLKLAEHPRVLLTPHNAFNTREAVERKVTQSIQQITHFLEHGKFLWTVPVSSDD